MRNFSSKSLNKVTRYRTPSSFKVRKAEAAKKVTLSPPYRPPGRGQRHILVPK